MDLKELYSIAKSQLSEIIKNDDPDFRLEQMEFNKAEQYWDIVVSYLEENKGPLNMPQYERIFKRVKINQNKELQGFYIYENS